MSLCKAKDTEVNTSRLTILLMIIINKLQIHLHKYWIQHHRQLTLKSFNYCVNKITYYNFKHSLLRHIGKFKITIKYELLTHVMRTT